MKKYMQLELFPIDDLFKKISDLKPFLETSMINRITLIKEQVSVLIANHESFQLHEMLTNLRKIHGITRKQIEKDISMPQHHLQQFETKGRSNYPVIKDILNLSIYYDIPFELLASKALKSYPRMLIE